MAVVQRGPGAHRDGMQYVDDEVEVKVGKRAPHWRERAHAWHAWLDQPVHGSSLGVFRAVFSVCMYLQACHFEDVFLDFGTSKGVYPYPGIGWVAPPTPETGEMLLRINKVAAVLTGLGLCTKAATVVLFLTFTWIFLICESNHNNHYILICHVTFVASFLDWGRWFSLDMVLRMFAQRRRACAAPMDAPPPPRETVPYWHLLLAQLLFSIPYFFGAIAKFNEDWLLRAQPLKMWLAPGSRHVSWVPFGFGAHWLFPWFIAFGGFGFDLTIVFLLFFRPTRLLLAFPAAFFFNCSNKMMFNIGIFPYAMLGSLTLFAEPDLFARLLAVCGVPTDVDRQAGPRWHRWWLLPLAPRRADELPSSSSEHGCLGVVKRGGGGGGGGGRQPLSWAQCFVLVFVSGFCGFHGLYPLRCHVIYPWGVSWHEEGHLGAWHMKLRSKHGWVVLVAREIVGGDAGGGGGGGSSSDRPRVRRTVYTPALDPLVNGRQKKKILSRPHALLLYATELAQLHRVANRTLSSLRAYSCFSLNDRAPAELFVPDADLLDHLGKYELLPPLSSSAVGVWLTAQPPVSRPPTSKPACSLMPPSPQTIFELDAEHSGRDDEAEGLGGRSAFQSLHSAAGLERVPWGQEMRVELRPMDGSPPRWSYMEAWHRVDDKLADYLARRPREPKRPARHRS